MVSSTTCEGAEGADSSESQVTYTLEQLSDELKVIADGCVVPVEVTGNVARSRAETSCSSYTIESIRLTLGASGFLDVEFEAQVQIQTYSCSSQGTGTLQLQRGS